MSATWKTVRVFISSTFRDMQAERDHLVRFVFPRLREELLARRIHLVDVDLRWGVTSEQDASEVCREVVDECHPRFLCMLGGRYGSVPKGKPRSITADEIHYGVLDREITKRGFAFFYFRDANATAAMAETTPGEFREPQDSDSQIALDKLKRAIADVELNPFTYPAQWDEQSRRLIGLAKFGEQVHDDLLRSMKDDPELRGRFTETTEKLDEFAEENAAMESFIEERTERFVLGSRTAVMDELLAHANGTGGNGYLCLVGEPGSGKSALLAKFSAIISDSSLVTDHSSLLISHFVGASTGSTDVRRTLRRLCDELISGTDITAEIPEDPEKLRVAFPEILQQSAAKKHVVILLDAVNQFDVTTQLTGLWWLPEELPNNARIILSTLPGLTLDDLKRRRNPPREVLLPVLTQTDGEAIIKEFLYRYRKTMTDAQRATLLKKKDAGIPLYLLAALEELRTLGTYEEITERIAQLPDETQALFTWILKRLEDDEGFRDSSGRKIGSELVSKFVSLMGVSRHGLSQRELAELLAPGDAKSATPDDAQGNVAALVQLLHPYLMRRGELLDFYHGQFRAAAENTFLKTDEQRQTSHQYLANYFVGCAKGSDPQKEWETESVRGFSECVFHFTKATKYAEAQKLLSNFPFLLHKARNGLLEGILTDYPFFESNAPKEFVQRLQIWADFFREKAHILRCGNEEWPTQKILLQLAVEYADDSPLTMAAEKWLVGGHCDWLWLRRISRLPHAQKNPCLAVLEGHSDLVHGALAVSYGRLLSWSNDKTLRLWDSRSGECVVVLEGHTHEVLGAKELSDGRLLSWSNDKTLRLWDGQSGACLAVLEGQTNSVKGVHLLSDRRLLSWSGDKELRFWDGQGGACVAMLEGHTNCVEGALVLANGWLLSWSCDNTLRMWDPSRAVCLKVLEGHTGRVCGAFELSERRILSWSEDGTLRVWDRENGICMAVLKGHTEVVEGALELNEGRLLSWARWPDAALRVWDGNSGDCVTMLDGHTGWIWGTLAMTDGRVLSWATDHTLRLWDARSGSCLAVLRGHTREIRGAEELSDGRLLSWSDDGTLRLWNNQDGKHLAVLKGHSAGFCKAMILADDRLMSWSEDKMLRLWNIQRMPSSTYLEGHSGPVANALALADGRLLTWAIWNDDTLRLWDEQSGSCLATLKGHTREIRGAKTLTDGRLLSWSGDKTLRLWDGRTGVCVAVLTGHTQPVSNVLELKDGRLVSRAANERGLRLWDSQSGACLDPSFMGGIEELISMAVARLENNRCTFRDFFVETSAPLASIHHKAIPCPIAVWQADSDSDIRSLQPDGILVVTQKNGQVCFLKLHHGNRRVSFAEAEEILAPQMQK